MSTRSKEEQQLLDEKIARIQKKNEEILRRRKEVEEDKRLAEQQNAVVKLRPSATTDRERTPALRPSKRQVRDEPADDDYFQEPVAERSSRGGFRPRGAERYRGQSDWKTTGPPPDPRSFLYDDERDTPSKHKEEKGDARRDLNRRREGEREYVREDFREGPRGRGGGGEYRMERGRRGGRGGYSRSQEDAWREERMKIDEARIQRQKSADGKWRREWDNEKILQDTPEEPRYEPRRMQTPSEEFRQSTNHYHCPVHRGPEEGPGWLLSESPPRGRGRGRLHPSELKKPLEHFPLELIKPPASTGKKSGSVSPRRPRAADAPTPQPSGDKQMHDGTRKIERVGESFKISICNTDAAQSTPKPQRQVLESRGRFKSQPSYSSQSDEDSPRERRPRGSRRPRSQKYSRGREKAVSEESATMSSDSKPPLPPTKTGQEPAPVEVKEDDDGSWEDVTTSGTESMGEEMLSNIISTSRSVLSKSEMFKEPIVERPDHPDEEVEVLLSDELSKSSIKTYIKEVSDQSLDGDQANVSGECTSLEVSNSDIKIISDNRQPDANLSQSSVSNKSVPFDDITSCNNVEDKPAIESEIETQTEENNAEEANLCFEEKLSEPLNTCKTEDKKSNPLSEDCLETVAVKEEESLLIDKRSNEVITESLSAPESKNDESVKPCDFD